ncbi:MAG: hypothetical protein K0R59_3508 [Sphingobacterium sp.]|jgi:hypothetical protein|nr:hypothetical protein [Sphingobacterium sp.]
MFIEKAVLKYRLFFFCQGNIHLQPSDFDANNDLFP